MLNGCVIKINDEECRWNHHQCAVWAVNVLVIVAEHFQVLPVISSDGLSQFIIVILPIVGMVRRIALL